MEYEGKALSLKRSVPHPEFTTKTWVVVMTSFLNKQEYIFVLKDVVFSDEGPVSP